MLTFTDWKENPHHGVHYYNGWKEETFEKLEALRNSQDPLHIMKHSFYVACDILAELPFELGIVCGPISTGKRSVEENLEIFNNTVIKISNEMPIFNQVPFEPVFLPVHELVKNNQEFCSTAGRTSEFFINHFYVHVFTAGKKWKSHFIHGWESSVGAVMEHEILTELKSEIIYLPEDFV